MMPERSSSSRRPAKQRCDEVLNPQFDAWLAGNSTNTVADAKTRKFYDSALRLVSQHKPKDGLTQYLEPTAVTVI
jgi:hypothetical protein